MTLALVVLHRLVIIQAILLALVVTRLLGWGLTLVFLRFILLVSKETATLGIGVSINCVLGGFF